MFGPKAVTYASIHFRFRFARMIHVCVYLGAMWENIVIELVNSLHTSKQMLPIPTKKWSIIIGVARGGQEWDSVSLGDVSSI